MADPAKTCVDRRYTACGSLLSRGMNLGYHTRGKEFHFVSLRCFNARLHFVVVATAENTKTPQMLELLNLPHEFSIV